ncbi:MAG: 1-(5-phosphoribosyl)-5-[(5-phosphoribosylamino)methylideneamino]imidazole-4-carboxamide isomerase [Spirochaetales bacterium]|jgi:phosphoribosylformimino-5-aminoimidazole carboxamide ribotide isomerase|nr:1-(5-phosphoribosyl)-5-[(5-phosphoribosylamino)methylideneamino]imidazole-4-carboxamide isomerase [Spirochaetales bacterium]
MIIIPAIDLLDGTCVRLRQGNYGEAVRYAQTDPVTRACLFEEAGIRRIHIVDLDAAKGEGNNNRALIRRIRKAVSCHIETGGGIRSEKDVEELLEAGADRLVLGTVFVRDPQAAGDWIRKYGKKFIAGIDARDGGVKISGWQEASDMKDTTLAGKAAALGAVSIIYTNISRDGTLRGPDIERTLAVGRAAGIPVILSGGISQTGDIQETAKKAENIISAVITGKAVYEGKIDLAGLVRMYPQDRVFDISW